MADPYLHAWWRQHKNRSRSLSMATQLRDILLPIIVAGLLVPMVRPTFLAFLDEPRAMWGELVFGLVMRLSMIIVAWISLDVYTALVRGPTREVLAILPVDPALVARAELVRVAAERWWLVPGAGIVLGPLALRDVWLWSAAVAALAGCFVLSLSASAAGHLLAIRVAESKVFAPLLDALRGNNPRAQAAFLYAPGAVLVAVSGALYAAASAVPRVAQGDRWALLSLLVPWIAAAVAWRFVPSLANATWFRGSIVLSEIDARYASLTDPAEITRVYLDWVPRLLPASWQPFALNDLRHGWRRRRTLVMLAWLVAVLSVGLSLATTADAPWRSAVAAVAGIFLVSANGVLMSLDEPLFLRAWLAVSGTRATAARTIVLLLWASPPMLLPPLVLLFRHGSTEALLVGATTISSAIVAVGLAALCGLLRERGVAAYAASSTLMGALMLGVAMVVVA